MPKRVLSKAQAKMLYSFDVQSNKSKRILKVVEYLARILLSEGYIRFTDDETADGGYLTTASVYAVKAEKDGEKE